MTSMTLGRIGAAAVVAVSMVLTVAGGAKAETKPPVIGIVDVQLIGARSEASRSIQKAIETQREAISKEFAGREQKLRAIQQDLDRQRAVLSQDAFAKKRKEFEVQFADFQRDGQTRMRALEQAAREASLSVEKVLFEIIGKVAKENDVTMVLARQQVVLWTADDAADLTPIVMDRLNKQIPSVTVKVNAGKK
ncbi:MAG: OmpH family outer membrane protein [Azospirillum sp.]|nr:OmpH family outer membrane protein [Azospirillum sp.]